MDPELARRLFAEGGVLVLLDVPERTEFGIDFNCWSVGPRFKGIKMIPPGLHLVYYCAVNRQGESAPRTSFFHVFERQEVVVRRWDRQTEDLTAEGITTDTAERIRAGLKDLDSSLGAYPYDTLKKWISLTNFVSADLLARLQPLSGKVTSVSQLERDTNRTGGEAVVEEEEEEEKERKEEEEEEKERQEEEEDEGREEREVTDYGGGRFAGVGEFAPALQKASNIARAALPVFKQNPEASLRLTEIPQQRYPEGASPAEISQHHIDLSFTLDTMLEHGYTHHQELLGELQFSFVCFFLAHVYDAFDHWKELVKLLCFCEKAITTHRDLFTSFISVLHFQLKEVPDDFFVDIVSKDNFLTTTLQVFFSSLEGSNSSADPTLVKKGLQFRDNLTKKYHWDFSSEPDEYAPTIVDTD